MTNQQVIQLTDEHVLNTYKRFPVALSHGEGAKLFDFEGNAYIDFASGIGVCSLGYGNEPGFPPSRRRLRSCRIRRTFLHRTRGNACKRALQANGMAGAFFGNSGAEANEGMIKLARKYSFDRFGEDRHTIITLNRSFHGRTVTTLAATGRMCSITTFSVHGRLPLRRAKRPRQRDCRLRRRRLRRNAGADSGEGGVLPLDKDSCRRLRRTARQNGLCCL
jgi:acetylornithine/N-succinyldiaminopimelate aminotransferase